MLLVFVLQLMLSFKPCGAKVHCCESVFALYVTLKWLRVDALVRLLNYIYVDLLPDAFHITHVRHNHTNANLNPGRRDAGEQQD
jgi:hypothetical protein